MKFLISMQEEQLVMFRASQTRLKEEMYESEYFVYSK